MRILILAIVLFLGVSSCSLFTKPTPPPQSTTQIALPERKAPLLKSVSQTNDSTFFVVYESQEKGCTSLKVQFNQTPETEASWTTVEGPCVSREQVNVHKSLQGDWYFRVFLVFGDGTTSPVSNTVKYLMVQ